MMSWFLNTIAFIGALIALYTYFQLRKLQKVQFRNRNELSSQALELEKMLALIADFDHKISYSDARLRIQKMDFLINRLIIRLEQDTKAYSTIQILRQSMQSLKWSLDLVKPQVYKDEKVPFTVYTALEEALLVLQNTLIKYQLDQKTMRHE